MLIGLSRYGPVAALAVCVGMVVVGAQSSDATGSEPSVSFTVNPLEATVGDHLQAVLKLHLPAGTTFEPPDMSGTVGELELLEGDWNREKAPEGEDTIWTWEAVLASYETGEKTIPAIALRIETANGASSTATETVTVKIISILPEGEEQPEIADLKMPASIRPEYGPLYTAFLAVGLLLLVSLVVWWLQRRFAHRIAAATQPEDPFNRMPPHVWAYQKLKMLLEEGVGDAIPIDLFYERLSRIMRRYLSGRYRIEMMEQTTEEIEGLLSTAGVGGEETGSVLALLRRCDLVKYARLLPDPGNCRLSVEEAYLIVDDTRPAEEPSADSGDKE